MNRRRRNKRAFHVSGERKSYAKPIIAVASIIIVLAAVYLAVAYGGLFGGGDSPAGTADPQVAPSPTYTPDLEPTPDLTPAPDMTSTPDATQPSAETPAPANPMASHSVLSVAPTATAATPAPAQTTATATAPAPTETPAALPLSGVKVGIDPGHQLKANREQEPVSPGSSETKNKVSSGTAGVKSRVAEYIVNLDVSLMLRDELVKQGAEVYMTRETHDVDISNIERAQMMNELGVDIVLRIHCNGSEDRSKEGIGLYIRNTGTGADECLRAAEALLPAMLDATGAVRSGIFKRDSYSGLNWSEVPSILVEMGYMSNPDEDLLLNDPEYQAKLVAGMVKGVADYMGRELESDEGLN